MNTLAGHKMAQRTEYTAQGRSYGAQYFTGGDSGRIILFPDWEGSQTIWARQIAQHYARTCAAEVILTDHYGLTNPVPSFDDAYRINQGLLGDPATSRPMLRSMVGALASHWKGAGPLMVVGFCSGGSFALETGRSGAGVDAVFCIHGGPHTPMPLPVEPGGADDGQRPVFTVIHGGDDPLITPSQLASFEAEMRAARARWALHVISGAKHSFTRFDSRRANHAIGYSHRAEVEARHLVRAQMCALREMSKN